MAELPASLKPSLLLNVVHITHNLGLGNVLLSMLYIYIYKQWKNTFNNFLQVLVLIKTLDGILSTGIVRFKEESSGRKN